MLRVEGNKIVDESGQPVRLRGMSMFWSQWMPQFWNADVAKWLADDWHVTLIRAAMAVDQGGYLQNPAAEKAKLEAIVQGCIDSGIYVIIDWHDYNAHLHVNEAKLFFSEMAQKYGRFPNVLFEPFNEPQQIDWSTQIKPYHEQIVPVIRQHTDNLVILGTRTWSQEVDTAAQNPVHGNNLAYTIHFYAASMGADLRARVSAALARGVPVFATEWGTCEYTGNGALNLQEAQQWLDFFEQHHISDANWAISDKAESCSALNPGASATGGWPASQLSQSGAWVRSGLQAYAREHQAVATGYLRRQYSSGKHVGLMDLPHFAASAVASLSAGVSSLLLLGAAVVAASGLVMGIVVVRMRGILQSTQMATHQGWTGESCEFSDWALSPCGVSLPGSWGTRRPAPTQELLAVEEVAVPEELSQPCGLRRATATSSRSPAGAPATSRQMPEEAIPSRSMAPGATGAPCHSLPRHPATEATCGASPRGEFAI
jgi:endoglucanase